MNWLNLGHSLVVFLDGSVATSQRPFRGPAVEYAWHPFVGKLARLPGVTVVPVYFHSQNSRIFQILSHTNYALRIALLFRESVRRVGSCVKVSVGEPIAPETLARLPDRNAAIAELRRATLALGGADASNTHLEFKFPKHVYSD